MLTLFLDLGSNKGCMAMISDDQVLVFEEIGNRMSDAALVPLYESLLKKAGRDQKDLVRVACVTGPGGFTSIRCAVSFTNALSFALGIPSAGIHLSDVYRARGSGLWMHSTKKIAVFLRTQNDAEAKLVEVTELQNHLQDTKEWMGELIPEHLELAQSLGLKEATLKPLEEVLPTLISERRYDKKILEPWYGRGF